MRQTEKKQPRGYSWALKFESAFPEERYLSEQGRRGLRYAQDLAGIARDRSQAALHEHARMPDKLTVAKLAAEEGTSAAKIHQLIRQAVIEIFGKDLSQSAIYYRLRQLEKRRGRTCAAPDCDEPIAAQDPISRLYCLQHRTPRSRTSRHREHKRAATNAQHANTERRV